MNDPPPDNTAQASRRKRRWGDSATPADGGSEGSANDGAAEEASKSTSRFSSSAPAANGAANGNGDSSKASADPRARAAALQASIQARLAALKARTAVPTPAVPPATDTPAIITSSAAVSDKKREASEGTEIKPAKKKARVFELDLNETSSTRLLEKQHREEKLRLSEKPKAKVNPYLAHTVAQPASTDSESKIVLSADTTRVSEEAELLDTRLAGGHIAKLRLKSRPINFVAPGTYVALGEKKRQQAARAEESGYVSGRKDGRVIQSVGMGGGALVADAAIGGGGSKGGSYYGADEAGKVVDEILPARVDAPDLTLEDYEIGGKKFKLVKSASANSDKEKQDAAINAAINASESAMPYAMEWWDAELLPSKLRKELASEEGKAIASRARKQAGLVGGSNADTEKASSPNQQQLIQREKHQKLVERCYKHANLSNSKTHALLQHPVPILTPAQKVAALALKNKPPTLHLTKAERKRHRKLRRAERLREQQDLQAAGLLPAPEPRLTLSNYMKVLGDQAVLDPSKMEARVMEQINQRKIKHEQMNADRKLTMEQKAQKHARKLAEDTSASVKVALFWVRDMSHPYHRAKVDLNAQQNSITGGVLECERPTIAGGGGGDEPVVLVVAEGGEKAIKRYTRLMVVRMRWKGEDFYEEEEEGEDLMVGENDDGEDTQPKQERKKFNPNNECELIWTGMAVKRAFHSFMFQSASNPTLARKILEAKGVAHYWDLAMGHVAMKEGGGIVGGGEGLRFRLGDDDSDTMED